MRADGRDLPYDDLIVATGSRPAVPPIEGLEELEAWSSREGTSASEVPESLLVIGGGAVGCELAQLYRRLGARVALVQNGDRLLPRMEAETAGILADALREEGIELHFGAAGKRVELDGGGFRLELDRRRRCSRRSVSGRHRTSAQRRRARARGARLRRSGRPGIVVDERLNAAPGVWAAGDVTGVALFTHVGKYQGRIAAANVAGEERRADYRAIPAAVFTDPQVATVGDTSGDGAVTASWPLSRSRERARSSGPSSRAVKLFADPERKVLVGAAAAGPEAGEWLGQLTLAVRAEVPVDVLRDTIQPFPTFSEAIGFAARDLAV